MSALLEVENLSVQFGTVKALQGVNLSINAGVSIGIVGESGSGKSTLGLTILGLLPSVACVSGTVRLNGTTMPWQDDAAMAALRGRQIAFVHQDPMSAFSPVHTIGTHLIRAIRRANPGTNKTDARKRAAELLGEVEISRASERLDHYPFEYSGGMRQRVMIAAALVGDPALLIADEPTTALDVTTQETVLALLERVVQARQMAMMLVTHDLGVVARACQQVAVMYGGQLMQRTNLDGLRCDAQHPYTHALQRTRPGNTPRGSRLPTIAMGDPNAKAHSGCPFEPRCPKGAGQALCRTQVPDLRVLGNDLIACHYPAGTSPPTGGEHA